MNIYLNNDTYNKHFVEAFLAIEGITKDYSDYVFYNRDSPFELQVQSSIITPIHEHY